MILFYNKKTGDIFATIDGRVHNEDHLKCYVNNGDLKDEEIGRYIIGYMENKSKKIASNMHKISQVESWEDITPDSPLDYSIDCEKNELKKIKKEEKPKEELEIKITEDEKPEEIIIKDKKNGST